MIAERRGEATGRSAVLLIDPASVEGAAVTHVLVEHGFEDVVVTRWTSLLESVVERAPAIVVIDLAMTGMAGSRLIAMVNSASPTTRIFAIAELDVIDAAALERGATVLARPGDLRSFTTLIAQVARSEPVPPSPVDG